MIIAGWSQVGHKNKMRTFRLNSKRQMFEEILLFGQKAFARSPHYPGLAVLESQLRSGAFCKGTRTFRDITGLERRGHVGRKG